MFAATTLKVKKNYSLKKKEKKNFEKPPLIMLSSFNIAIHLSNKTKMLYL
jgi:hypothetical protein